MAESVSTNKKWSSQKP